MNIAARLTFLQTQIRRQSQNSYIISAFLGVKLRRLKKAFSLSLDMATCLPPDVVSK